MVYMEGCRATAMHSWTLNELPENELPEAENWLIERFRLSRYTNIVLSTKESFGSHNDAK